MKVVNLHAAKTHLSRLVDAAARGEEITIAKSGKPVVRLVPVEAAPPRRPGMLRGRIKVRDDFDAPLPAEALAAFVRGPIMPPPKRKRRASPPSRP